MNSRERVRNLLRGKAVDRIPNGLGGAETAGLHIMAYNKLKKVLGVSDPKTRMYTFMTNAVMELSVLEAMKGDIVILNSKLCPVPLWGYESEKRWKEETFWGKKILVPEQWKFRTESDGTIWWDTYGWKCTSDSIYFDPVPDSNNDIFARKDKPNPDDYNPSHGIVEEKLRSLEESAKWLYENTDYAIQCGETFIDLQLKPGGTVGWWMRLIEEPDVAHEFLDKACQAALSQLKLLDQAVGKYEIF